MIKRSLQIPEMVPNAKGVEISYWEARFFEIKQEERKIKRKLAELRKEMRKCSLK